MIQDSTGRDRTAAARAARKRNSEGRIAAKLHERGWLTVPPETPDITRARIAELLAGCERAA